MISNKTIQTVELLATAAATKLLAAQATLTDQFAAGAAVTAGTMETLILAQAEARLTAQLQTRWNRGGMVAIEAWLEDAAEVLMEGNAGGSSSLVQNAMDVAERKAMQAAYKALNRCR